ncbi:DamX protein [Enterobacter sp. BIGb0383]|uniref:cell division protein DamX n=1 Tax=unclassified Enterobacter TaxID=2608935 RepID=UPI000F48CFF6|nr:MULTISPECIES: cell division protein DamX [unclassified Enterobacter]ROP56438.1 DamX protein [Enterobacter sp. BIGb0383]ROS04504.1 DamX protein [Enterobacter sp. BIGb0359]
MDEFKPEDDLKPDPSDRRTGRSRQVSDRDNEPQINFDDVDLDTDERRPPRGRKPREDEYDDADDDYADEDEDEQTDRRPAKRKKALAGKSASRQYVMMAVGILVLLLLIAGIGSALKSPVTANNSESSSEKSIDLSGNDGAGQTAPADQNNGAQATPAAASTESNAGAQPSQDVSLPPIASTPTQGQTAAAPEGQQRVEVQGDLNSALSQQQGQLDNVVANSTLPTEPATVAPLRNGATPRQAAATGNESQPRQPATTANQGRQHVVIEAKPQSTAKAPVTEAKPAAAQPKRVESSTPRAPVTAPTAAQPKATASTATPPASTSRAAAGDVNALKSAPGSHYTLQLSSSSNYNNLNSWAKKANLKNYVVYQTTRNGQPWYVLVSGVYASKDDAKRAVSALPADVQAKNPWTKPMRQVQAELK